MTWVSLGFLVVLLVAVVAFRLGHAAGSRSASGRILDRNDDLRTDVVEPMRLSPPLLERVSARSEVSAEPALDKREEARRIFQQLKQLEKMRDDGMLTSTEYSAKRTELLRES